MSLHLTAANISKSYSGELILKDCSYSFSDSGIYVLTGSNGSGKSTFLRICALIEEPDTGEVIFSSDGRSLICDVSLRRRITLLLPKVGVFNTSVYKNIAYGLKIRGYSADRINNIVDRALDFVGLDHKKNQKAVTLSSGETQRLGIARALAIDPEILFLDEPTASVDQKNTKIIEDIILKMKREKRLIIVTTHDKAQAERLSDFLLTIKEGSIREG